MAHAQLLAARVGPSGVLAGLRMGHLGRPGLLYRTALEGATFSLSGGYDTMRAVVDGQIDGMPDVHHCGLGEISLVSGVLLL